MKANEIIAAITTKVKSDLQNHSAAPPQPKPYSLSIKDEEFGALPFRRYSFVE